jgi:undecaprenyl diphosphate synthase
VKLAFDIKNKELFKDRQYYINTPKHALILPDGDRRYAKEHGLTDFESYDLARKRTIEFLEVGFNEFELDEISIFFLRQRSFNNQNRTVNNLKSIFTAIQNLGEDLTSNKTGLDIKDISINIVTLAGKKWMEIPEGMDQSQELVKAWFQLKKSLDKFQKQSVKKRKINFLINYSGKVEIEEAIKTKKFQITNPIGLTLRVGEGMRLSDCPLYSLSESHMYLIPKYYPEVTKVDYRNVLSHYYTKKS